MIENTKVAAASRRSYPEARRLCHYLHRFKVRLPDSLNRQLFVRISMLLRELNFLRFQALDFDSF